MSSNTEQSKNLTFINHNMSRKKA